MSKDDKTAALVLAAGKGTRMKSDLAKVLHPVCGRPMLAYVLDCAREVGVERIVVVVGHQAKEVRRAFADDDLVFVEQERQLGTGHAVLQAAGAFDGYRGDVLILCGDVPLLRPATLRSLLDDHRRQGAAVTVMTVFLDDPGSYGRVLRDADGSVRGIVEARDCTGRELAVGEINTGIYCADASFLFDAVGRIGNDNAQGEYYLTDIMAIAHSSGLKTAAFVAPDPREVMGINTPEDLAEAERIRCGGG
ncbi:MAG TPA: NTP transferase domain-containing protein [Syntrophales bacterium]|nr:NTP transferase domain-containing protein [Syntrophales bacterium]HOM07530.1 NTP transferase domain-containing protein [Syntrophales bacterium]HON99857.1 NTP transferase domain-containing protein [Syntrophales bacterium]HPC02015.1 NTP transferase domain-containing protein [Syntrophales bacterium]HPQ07125.1 NTP transferase domain-containing protein [Syntrophales bacterium]